MQGNFEPSQQCVFAASRANWALRQLRHTVISRDPTVLFPLYKALIRPHLEYCVQTWSRALVRVANMLEAVHRRLTRSVAGMAGLCYEDRLAALKLFSLKRRRCRGDLIEAFKQLKGLSDTGERLLHRARMAQLRGHSLKLDKPRVHSALRANQFASRVINYWNRLPQGLFDAQSVGTFISRLDKVWTSAYADVP